MKMIYVLVILALFSGCQATTENSEMTQEEDGPVYTKISPEEALKKMGEEGVIVIDVREPAEFAEGHVEGAQLLPLGNIRNGNLELIPDKDQLILIYCRSGNRSGQAAKILVDEGYTNVMDFGGILDWPYEVVQ